MLSNLLHENLRSIHYAQSGFEILSTTFFRIKLQSTKSTGIGCLMYILWKLNRTLVAGRVQHLYSEVINQGRRIKIGQVLLLSSTSDIISSYTRKYFTTHCLSWSNCHWRQIIRLSSFSKTQTSNYKYNISTNFENEKRSYH